MLSIDGNFSDAGCFKFPTIHYHSVHGLVLFVLRESHLAPAFEQLGPDWLLTKLKKSVISKV